MPKRGCAAASRGIVESRAETNCDCRAECLTRRDRRRDRRLRQAGASDFELLEISVNDSGLTVTNGARQILDITFATP